MPVSRGELPELEVSVHEADVVASGGQAQNTQNGGKWNGRVTTLDGTKQGPLFRFVPHPQVFRANGPHTTNCSVWLARVFDCRCVADEE